jgi:hypothetical protein
VRGVSALPPVSAFDVFTEDEPGTITVPGQSPIEDVAILWLPSEATQAPIGTGAVLDVMPRLALRVDQVPHIPRGTRIEAPSLGGGATQVYIVRDVVTVDAQYVIVAVVGTS